jgi:Flp pilus assembly protein CpaB
MKRYRWFVIAILAVLLLALTIYLPPRPKPEMVQVVIARVEVPAGQYLKDPERFFDQQTVAKERVPEGAVTEMKDLRGKLVARAIDPGAFVHQRRDLVEPLTPALNPGERAVTLRVHIDREIVNRAPPGTYVDLLCKKELPNGQIEWTLLAERVLSLSV